MARTTKVNSNFPKLGSLTTLHQIDYLYLETHSIIIMSGRLSSIEVYINGMQSLP